MMYPKSLEKLFEQIKKLPSVGNKTAQRYGMALLSLSQTELDSFLKAIQEAKDKIHPCPICGNLTEDHLCSICQDPNRDKTVICVVSHPSEIIAFEKTGQYKGLYHCLNGLISISNHVLPEDLNLSSLNDRIKEGVKEVVLALSSTIEGETTSYYLVNSLSDRVKVTQLATGLPMGSHVEYMDELTLLKALQNRQEAKQEEKGSHH